MLYLQLEVRKKLLIQTISFAEDLSIVIVNPDGGNEVPDPVFQLNDVYIW